MAHENLQRHQQVEGSSDRAFGLVFTALFTIIACWPLFYAWGLRWWALRVAILFALIAWIKPALLAGLNRLWIKLGVLLGKLWSRLRWASCSTAWSRRSAS